MLGDAGGDHFYHVVSRVVNRDLVFGEVEKEHFRRLLERHHYSLDEAASVAEAQSNFRLSDYDLIISDLRLPGAPGTEPRTAAEPQPGEAVPPHAIPRVAES